MSETLQGVLIGGLIGFLGSVIVQYFETNRHRERLEEERKQRREEQWFRQMSGPFLSRRREALEALVELLLGPKSNVEACNEARLMQPYAPEEVQRLLKEWFRLTRASESGEGTTGDSEIAKLRAWAGAFCAQYLRDAMTPQVMKLFVEETQLPWMESEAAEGPKNYRFSDLKRILCHEGNGNREECLPPKS